MEKGSHFFVNVSNFKCLGTAVTNQIAFLKKPVTQNLIIFVSFGPEDFPSVCSLHTRTQMLKYTNL